MCITQLGFVIETSRLQLRRPQSGDAARIAELANDFDVARMTASLPHPYDLSDAEAYLAQTQSAEPEELALFAIEHPDDGLIGMIGFDSDGTRKTELGYWLGKAYWGRGFATEAAQAALGWVNRAWKRRVVTARHFSDNPASGEVLCKAGFLYTGDVNLSPSRARGADVPSRMMVWLA